MPFILPIQVSPADIDDLGHVSNLVYLRWVLQAAVGHSAAVGLSPRDYHALGQAFVVHRHEVDYLRPAFAGDLVRIETRVVSMRAVRSERETQIWREEPGSQGPTLLCQARTRWAFMDLKTGRPARIPEDISARFSEEPGVLMRTRA